MQKKMGTAEINLLKIRKTKKHKNKEVESLSAFRG